MTWSDLIHRDNLIGGIIHSNEFGFLTRGILDKIIQNDQGVIEIMPMGGRLLEIDHETGSWNFSPRRYSGWRFHIDKSSQPVEEKSVIRFSIIDLGEITIYPVGVEIPLY